MVQLSRFLYVPYRAIRIPLAVVDARLPERTIARRATSTALGITDALAARLFEEPLDPPVTPARPAAPAESSRAEKPTPESPDATTAEDEQRHANLEEDRKRKERAATRGNKNLATMQRDLARAEAVVDAHEERRPTGG